MAMLNVRVRAYIQVVALAVVVVVVPVAGGVIQVLTRTQDGV